MFKHRHLFFFKILLQLVQFFPEYYNSEQDTESGFCYCFLNSNNKSSWNHKKISRKFFCALKREVIKCSIAVNRSVCERETELETFVNDSLKSVMREFMQLKFSCTWKLPAQPLHNPVWHSMFCSALWWLFGYRRTGTTPAAGPGVQLMLAVATGSSLSLSWGCRWDAQSSVTNLPYMSDMSHLISWWQ